MYKTILVAAVIGLFSVSSAWAGGGCSGMQQSVKDDTAKPTATTQSTVKPEKKDKTG